MTNPLLKPQRQTCFGSTSAPSLVEQLTRFSRTYLEKQGSFVRVTGLESVFPETTTVVVAKDEDLKEKSPFDPQHGDKL